MQRCLPIPACHAMNLSAEWCKMLRKCHGKQITIQFVQVSLNQFELNIGAGGPVILPTRGEFCSSRHLIETKQCCAINECGAPPRQRQRCSARAGRLQQRGHLSPARRVLSVAVDCVTSPCGGSVAVGAGAVPRDGPAVFAVVITGQLLSIFRQFCVRKRNKFGEQSLIRNSRRLQQLPGWDQYSTAAAANTRAC